MTLCLVFRCLIYQGFYDALCRRVHQILYDAVAKKWQILVVRAGARLALAFRFFRCLLPRGHQIQLCYPLSIG
jgi:hypothetical protein